MTTMSRTINPTPGKTKVGCEEIACDRIQSNCCSKHRNVLHIAAVEASANTLLSVNALGITSGTTNHSKGQLNLKDRQQ